MSKALFGLQWPTWARAAAPGSGGAAPAVSRGWTWALGATLAATAFTAWWAPDTDAPSGTPTGAPTGALTGTPTGTPTSAPIDAAAPANAPAAARATRLPRAALDSPIPIGLPTAHRDAAQSLPERAPWPTPAPLAVAAWGLAPARPVAASAAARPASAAAAKRAVSATASASSSGPAPAASATAAPAAPTPEFRYAGRITTEGKRRAMLVTAQGTWVVGEADTIAGQWRVDRISDDAVWLTWLPGGLPQRLIYTS